ncbi:hypothetical protein [Treponema endosymbiont of Eucomonympha sp.]|uniref:hypothetical protein n=1 Tax=Treponema endosymbiont of Eucomonympha sp. TaxID=1580831 RepID=UPI000A935D8A|nr:hypothetical protein [Treponema endosymbiont of Eucomonympha sp.]
MERDNYVPMLLNEFQAWYERKHGRNEDSYKNLIVKTRLSALSKVDFIDFFYKFIEDGGKVQSCGNRTKNLFRKETLENNYNAFRAYVFEPFSDNFNIKNWLFDKNSQIRYFGIGISTIYLNRIDKNRYPILNNKTLDGLQQLGFDIPSTKT